MKKILIVDDEDKIRELIRVNLEIVGYNCNEAEDGNKALDIVDSFKPDLVLLDIMLPGKDGFELVDEFTKRNIPVIFLTAKDSTVDKVKGLKLGAEDYITKPFDPMELLARVEVVLRRSSKNNETFKYKNLEIDFNERTVLMDGNEVELTTKEFDLLEVLIRNKNLALSREKLLEMVWGYEYLGDTRTIDIHITRLRKKLDLEDSIITVFKYGYRFKMKED
jgi:DNA-binding response OmpR family regulator